MPLRLIEIAFSGGDSVNVSDVDVVLLVGPNNSGKTQVLEGIEAFMRNGTSGFAVGSVRYELDGTTEELVDWFRTNRSSSEDQRGRTIFHTRGSNILDTSIRALAAPERNLEDLVNHLVAPYRLQDRLALGEVHESEPVDAANPVYVHPPQRLADDDELTALVDEYVYEAFRTHVVVDGLSPKPNIRLSTDLIDLSDTARLRSGRPAPEEVQRLLAGAAPIVSGQVNQGHGVQAFLSMILRLVTFSSPVTLLDEPEAFLHPPQARVFGRALARPGLGDGQIIVATHSLGILEGLLSGVERRIKVVRLTNTGDGISAAELDPDELRGLWEDPLLRESGALDGLFHDGVVVTEGASDAQFLSSVYESLTSSDRTVRWPHLLFAPAGSKESLHRLSGPLATMGVPVGVVADVDLLNDSRILRNVVESLDEAFSSSQEDVRSRFDQAVRSHGQDPTAEDVLRETTEMLSGVTGQLDRDQIRALRRIPPSSQGWSLVKQNGVDEVAGDVTAEVRDLIRDLESRGVFVLERGELEAFDRSLPGHGHRWVLAAWEAGIHNDQDGDAMSLMSRIGQMLRE